MFDESRNGRDTEQLCNEETRSAAYPYVAFV